MDEEMKPADATTDATDMPVDEGTEEETVDEETPVVSDTEESA